MKRIGLLIVFGVLLLLSGSVQAVTLNSGECITSNNVTYCAVLCVPVNKTTCSSFIEEGIINRTEYLEETCLEMENLFNAVKYARDNVTKTINDTYGNLGPGFLDELALCINKSKKYEKLYEECNDDLVKYSVQKCKDNISSLTDDLARYTGLYNAIYKEQEEGSKKDDPLKNLPECIYQMEIAQSQSNYGWLGGGLVVFIIMMIYGRKNKSSVDKTYEGILRPGEVPRTGMDEEKNMIAKAKAELEKKLGAKKE